MTETEQILTEIREVKTTIYKRIDELENRLLEPDNGLYARVKNNTCFRKSALRWLKIGMVTIIGLIAKLIYDLWTKKTF